MRRSDDFPTTCPFCLYRHDAITSVCGDGVPTDGAVTLCINCGRLCIIDDSAKGGLRKPTRKEQRRIDRDPLTSRMAEAWNFMRQKNLKA